MFDVFVFVYTLPLVTFAFVAFAVYISFIRMVFIYVGFAYCLHVNDIRSFRVTILYIVKTIPLTLCEIFDSNGIHFEC